MIPFFRKIRKTLADDNKPLKYFRYAIGEIVLVVIGILIALQINNWHNNRIERKKEVNYITNINKEFKLNKTQLDTVTFYHQIVYDNTKKILDLIPIDINTVNKDSLSSYISKTIFHYTFNPQQSTVNSLTNTSSFEIISNLELRELLQRWEEIVNDYQEEELLFREYSFDNYVPLMSKHISFIAWNNNDNIFDYDDIEITFLNNLEFKNAVAIRQALIIDVLGDELKEINKTIDRIIELTTTE